MAKKTLYRVLIEYKLHEYDSIRIDSFFAYAFNECHALQCVLRKLHEEYSLDSLFLVNHKISHVFNFVL